MKTPKLYLLLGVDDQLYSYTGDHDVMAALADGGVVLGLPTHGVVNPARLQPDKVSTWRGRFAGMDMLFMHVARRRPAILANPDYGTGTAVIGAHIAMLNEPTRDVGFTITTKMVAP